MSIADKFIERGMIIDGKFYYKSKGHAFTVQDVCDQINTIRDMHYELRRLNSEGDLRFQSVIGKKVEEYKINAKRMRRYFNNLSEIGAQNEFEQHFLSIGDELITRAELSVKEVYKNKYMELILRSMNKKELCLRKTYFNNLSKVNDHIVVKDISEVCYEMYEMDCVALLNRVKGKISNEDIKNLSRLYCEMEELNEYSNKFILAMLSYPQKFTRIGLKYFKSLNEEDKIECLDRIRNIVKDEGESLID